MKKTILILNGSPAGRQGNCQRLISRTEKLLKKNYKVETVQLKSIKSYKKLLSQISSASGVIFVTGTYWDSWGSPLQRLLENWTELEGSNAIMGKPCCVLVLNHSVGGKGVLSRLQGVLSTMGFLIPPMSGIVYSLVADDVLTKTRSIHADDLWSLEDLEIVFANFVESLSFKGRWQSWPVDRKNFRRVWLK